MKLIVAKTAGFCMGVRRAVEMGLDTCNKHAGPIYSYGPLIHNPLVLDLLNEKGISVLSDIPPRGDGTVLIRAHGVPPHTRAHLEKAGFRVLDATCPRVIKVQTIIRTHAVQGYASIIVGDRDHPEVAGLLGFAGGRGHVVSDLEGLDALPEFEKAIIVAQTTQNTRFFQQVKAWARQHHPHYHVHDTICDSTIKRQAETKSLAESVDTVVVVGGRNSGNTQRLVEIVQQTGKPALHIESESELEAADFADIGKNGKIGVTAGASTPNWVTKRVCNTLESLPVNRFPPWQRLLTNLQQALLLTSIYVAVGAGCLCYACMQLLGIKPIFPHVAIAVLYVLSMHILNHLIGEKSDQYNDPERAAFFANHKLFLKSLAVSAGAVGLATSCTLGRLPFLILLAMSLLGLSYNVRWLPRLPGSLKYKSIRDLPGSKTILIAVAWGAVTTLIPALSVNGGIDSKVVVLSVWSMGMVFVRTAYFDVLAMQGDRIVGKETLPILLGEKKTLRLLKRLLFLLMVLLPAAAAFQVLPRLGYALVVCPVFVLTVLLAHEQGRMTRRVRLEVLVESQFILAGGLAFLTA